MNRTRFALAIALGLTLTACADQVFTIRAVDYAADGVTTSSLAQATATGASLWIKDAQGTVQTTRAIATMNLSISPTLMTTIGTLGVAGIIGPSAASSTGKVALTGAAGVGAYAVNRLAPVPTPTPILMLKSTIKE